ncbi:Mucin-associated surface protein (MASP), subgroup S010 [Trypanosoma cruzi]|nr:Mucin-associated surface protein (MASP), subgroup S010 [Trypanosoma cruzi]
MAMMMTGRVLLVCALCVLWCSADGGCEEASAGFQSDASDGLVGEGVDSQDSPRPETPGSHTAGPETPPPNVQGQALSPPPEVTVSGTEGAAEEEKARRNEDVKLVEKEKEGDGTSQEVKEPENKLISVKDRQSHDNEGLQPPSLNGTHEAETITPSEDSLQVNKGKQDLPSPLQLPLPNSAADGNPSSTSAAGRGDEKSHENGNGTRNSQQSVAEDIEQNKDAGEKVVAPTGGEEDSRLPVMTVEEMRGATTKGNSGSSTTAATAMQSDTGTEGTPTNNHPNRPSIDSDTPLGTISDGEAASANKYDTVSQSAGSTTAPTTNAKTGETAMPGSSDSGTAVSHTTSPLLLLLVVACAAAAAVVAA